MKMCKNKWVFAHRIPPGLPKSSQLRFKILSFTFKFQTDSSKIQILFSIFKIPTSRALASKVQGFSIQGFSIQGLSNQRIQRIERMGALAPIQRLVYIYIYLFIQLCIRSHFGSSRFGSHMCLGQVRASGPNPLKFHYVDPTITHRS